MHLDIDVYTYMYIYVYIYRHIYAHSRYSLQCLHHLVAGFCFSFLFFLLLLREEWTLNVLLEGWRGGRGASDPDATHSHHCCVLCFFWFRSLMMTIMIPDLLLGCCCAAFVFDFFFFFFALLCSFLPFALLVVRVLVVAVVLASLVLVVLVGAFFFLLVANVLPFDSAVFVNYVFIQKAQKMILATRSSNKQYIFFHISIAKVEQSNKRRNNQTGHKNHKSQTEPPVFLKSHPPFFYSGRPQLVDDIVYT